MMSTHPVTQSSQPITTKEMGRHFTSPRKAPDKKKSRITALLLPGHASKRQKNWAWPTLQPFWVGQYIVTAQRTSWPRSWIQDYQSGCHSSANAEIEESTPDARAANCSSANDMIVGWRTSGPINWEVYLDRHTYSNAVSRTTWV